MRSLSLIISLLFVTGMAQADDQAAAVKASIDKGLAFLAKDSLTWKTERKCSSCHQIPMALWSLNEAKKLGYAVDDKAVTELMQWVLAADDPAKIFPKAAPQDPKAKPDEPKPDDAKPEQPKETFVNQAPLMLALAFEAGDAKDDPGREGLKKMLASVVKDQRPDGTWGVMYVWEPYGGKPDSLTNLALLSLASPNAPDLGEAGKAAQEKGLAWLTSTKADETLQRSALKLILWRRLGKPAGEQEPLVKQILGWQNEDGGWAQNKELKSDSYSTGQALYALAEAGYPLNDAAIAKAQAFLVKSQQENGSWTMASRPGGPGGKSAKNSAPIGYAGTAWAVMGLMRSAPK